MGSFRFYKRVSILPGLRVNLNTRSASVSIGHRGAWLTCGSRGTRATLGLPGSGLFWTETIPPAPNVRPVHSFSLVVAIIVIALVLSVLGIAK